MAGRVASATIASGASQSDTIVFGTNKLLSLQMPSGWTAAAITFLGSNDGVTFVPIYDDSGTEATIASANVAASRGIGMDALAAILASWWYLKIRSGTAAAAVNQGAARTIYLGMTE